MVFLNNRGFSRLLLLYVEKKCLSKCGTYHIKDTGGHLNLLTCIVRSRGTLSLLCLTHYYSACQHTEGNSITKVPGKVIIYIYIGKVKVLDLAYNRRKTQDKRTVGHFPSIFVCSIFSCILSSLICITFPNHLI